MCTVSLKYIARGVRISSLCYSGVIFHGLNNQNLKDFEGERKRGLIFLF